MSSSSQITKHARKRLKERTKLTDEQLSLIFGHKRYINTGKKPGCLRDHLLFYSIPDDDFFVGLQDVTDGSIVTILPLNYHKDLAWDVTEEQKTQAKEIMLRTTGKDISSSKVITSEVIYVRVHYITEAGSRRSKVIDKKRAEDYGYNPQRVISDKKFLKEITWLIKELGVDGKAVIAVSVRMGQYADPIFVDIDPAIFEEKKSS